MAFFVLDSFDVRIDSVTSLYFLYVRKNKKTNMQGCEKMSEMSSKNVNRFDLFDEYDAYMIEPMIETKEGYLTGRAKVTNVGIFNYRDSRGGTLRELRSPEEVFSEASTETLKMIPITNNHPAKHVNSENAKDLQVGYTGQIVTIDSYSLSISLTITDQKAIDDIRSGKVALSCGYTADLELANGMAFGNNQYDAIQKNIRYNHIAIVDAARAGDTARLLLRHDSDAMLIEGDKKEVIVDKGGLVNKSSIDISELMTTCHDESKGGIRKMKKIFLDNVEYQAEQEVINKLNASNMDNAEKQAKIDKLSSNEKDLKSQLSKLQADRDTLADELKKKQFTADDLNRLVAERVAVIDTAKKLKIKYSDTDSLVAIKKAVITSQYENAKLDDKDDVYINARYDAICETIDAIVAKKNNDKNNQQVFGGIQDAGNLLSTQNGNEYTAHEKFCLDIEDAYKLCGGE